MTKKKKGLRLLVMFLAAVLLCGGYVFVLRADWEETDGEIIQPEILDLYPNEVHEVKIENIGGTILLSYDGETWKSEDEPEMELNQDSLNNLMNRLHPLSAVRDLGEVPEKLETYGLKDPVIRISVAKLDGSEFTISLGSDAADGNVYLMTSEREHVYTVDSSLASAFDCTLEDLKALEEEKTEEEETSEE